MQRVLVVEDDYLQADWVCDLLETEGLEPVGPAADAKAAHRLLDTVSVDAAILDVRLQEGLGFKVAQTLMQREIPFLFLTGATEHVLPKDFQAVPLLYKPAEPRVLLELLRTLLAHKRE